MDDHPADLVLAALAGPEALEAAIAGGAAERPASGPTSAAKPVPGAYLTTIEVAGFRGIGPAVRLELLPSPGLTVVVGRNGSGKSSFAEALEVLLTGDSWRWRNKSAVWKQGWRNLHAGAGARVAATFTVEGRSGPTTMTREWGDDAKDAADASTVVQPHGGKQTDLTGYGWASPISLHRPLLSHSELGEVADNPSTLFDALSKMLGLDELAAASEHMRKRRLNLESPLKVARKELKDRLMVALAGSDDERAARCVAVLEGRSWDLEAAEAAAAGVDSAPEGADRLDALARLAVPNATDVADTVAGLAAAHNRVRDQAGTEAGRSRRVMDLLETALAEHGDHGDRFCPVCGVGSLDASWRSDAEAQLAELARSAAAYDDAAADLSRAMTDAANLVRPPPSVLADDGADVDVAAARAAWDQWAQVPDDPAELAEHLGATYPTLEATVAKVVAEATARRAALEDAWRPLAAQVTAWVASAREAFADDERAKDIKVAEDALAAVTADIRTRRFEPISRQAMDLWEALRLESNVELTGVELTGKGSQRRVDLAVTVDGTVGSALGVVSQGEFNCLALSLFFPRVMLPESPFGFIVIDDPVQAMDPARVDGLAKVLAGIAESRQLVVFTHDDRLPSSLLNLSLPHTVLQVTRRKRSVVEVRERVDPVNQYFRDARDLEKDEHLPDGIATRVVPGFCRSGIEAACMEAVRRRRIGRGDSHLAVEEALVAARTTTTLAALALFDDGHEGSRVLTEINRRWGRPAGDALKDCQAGTHQAFSGSLSNLIMEAEKLATGLRGVK